MSATGEPDPLVRENEALRRRVAALEAEAHTERSRAEALQQSEARLNFSLQTINAGVWEVDLRDHTATRTLTHDRIFGYQTLLPSWTFEMFLEHVLPEDRPDVERHFRENTAARTDWNFECRIRRVDGEVRWLWSAGGHERTTAGDPVRMYGIVQDITERKRAEQKLRQSEAEYRSLFENAIIGISQTSLDGNLIRANQAYAQMYGYSTPQEMMAAVKQSVAQLYANPDDRSEVLRILSERGVMEPREIAVIKRDGSQFVVLASAREIRDASGHLVCRQAEHVDVTERHSLEQQLRVSQKLEAIGSLAGGIAHDFNNLLSVIMCCTEFAIARLPDDDRAKEELLEAKKAGARAVALTRQLLAFSRKQVLQPVVLNLNEIATGVEKMLRRILGEDIDYVQVLAPDLGMVRADPGQIEQVFMNLVVNARDAMPNGGKLTIETSNVDFDEEYAARHLGVKPVPYVHFAVSDTGFGMDAVTQTRIFEPFFTTKEKGKGTGLGLSTVYGIVKQSGGHVWVYSEPGQGTTFRIYLPRDISAGTTVTGSRLAAVADRPTGTETILVVEDEEAVREVAGRILHEAGYTVLTAASPDDALVTCAANQGDIHLLLTDVVMPQMSGRVLAENLALARPGMKVLYMSGYTDGAIVHHGTLDPGTNFIAKPFGAADLRRKVREVLDGDVATIAEWHEQTAKPDSAMKGLDREALRGLPSEVLGKLRQAVIAARYDELVVLIEIIRNTDPRLASVLRGMADLFDYDGLREMLS
jgi:PAS domain S-box-containing protein